MDLDDYILHHIDAEGEYLHELWRDTQLRLSYGQMASGHLQGRLLKMLVQMIRPRMVLELGTFSGYSALSMAEGLEDRILAAAKTEVSRAALIDAVKTRRYTQGRISRALCHGLMGVKKSDLPDLPSSARILGFRESAQPLLRALQSSGFPLYSRPARAPDAALDVRADEMWRIGAGLPRGDTYRRSPVILP